ncbi:amidohydrolase family protein, partial [Bacteroidota bacterium]
SITILLSNAQSYKTSFPQIPRIDPHMHMYEKSKMQFERYLSFRDSVKTVLDADVVLWINMSANNPDSARVYTNGRMLCAMRSTESDIDFSTKEQFDSLKNAGYVGYKIWYGPFSRREKSKHPYIDDPAHNEAFSTIEKEGVQLLSLHIADPNGPFEWRTKWAPDPVEYWRQIIGFERVLSRHPDMKVIAAHGAWLMTQDAQLDFLRYMLDTYPNFNVDISATMEYSNLQSYDNLRDFYIDYQDRLIWASDMSDISSEQTFNIRMELYENWFHFLETTDSFGKDISSNGKDLKGLGLPADVLKKLYYKNALRLYPKEVEDTFNSLR